VPAKKTNNFKCLLSLVNGEFPIIGKSIRELDFFEIWTLIGTEIEWLPYVAVITCEFVINCRFVSCYMLISYIFCLVFGITTPIVNTLKIYSKSHVYGHLSEF